MNIIKAVGFVEGLVFFPKRELALQEIDDFFLFGQKSGLKTATVYGGTPYGKQIERIKQASIVVATPGRLQDLLMSGKIKINPQFVVLDEADEMLRMGFIEEVEWILEKTPAKRQMALFSATMPRQIEKIAKKYLNKPQQVAIKTKTATAATIRQRYWQVSGLHKLDAFTRIREVEDFDAMLVFVRTKVLTTEIAERLAARGYAVAATKAGMARTERETMDRRRRRGS